MYDKTILAHYANVANLEGNLESCTMADEYIRKIETEFILIEIKKVVEELKNKSKKKLKLCDVGCGNGYTLKKISESFLDIEISGIEFTPELRKIANQKNLSCEVEFGDIRKIETIPKNQNLIVSQRVLINLLSIKDQEKAILNLIASIQEGGYIIFIEAFNSGLKNLNDCRKELGMIEIPPAHHNLYLDDDFFDQFKEIEKVETELKENALSTHYFISRVLHDLALTANNANFTRNSMFVNFFDTALPAGIGNFSPLKFLVFKKKI